MVSLSINGKHVEMPEGSTILEAAKKLDIHIPTLCHFDLHDISMVNEVATDAPLTKFIYTSREVAAGGSHALICHPGVENLKSQFPGTTIC